MRNILLLVLIAFGAAAFAQQGGNGKQGAKQEAKQEAKTKKLTRAQFDQLFAKPGEVLLIDVRRPDEQTSIGSFPVYLSIQANDLEKYLAFIPKDRTLIPVSNHANRAVRAGDLLDSKGFKVAGAIGVEDYEAEGGTVLKIAPPANDGKNKDGKGK